VDRRTALVAGAVAAVAVVLVGRFVATQPWYDKGAFQVVLGTLLALVVVRMLTRKDAADTLATDGAHRGLGRLAATGAGAGTIAALAGVGVWLGLASGLAFAAVLLTWRWARREALGLTGLPPGERPRPTAS